MYTNANKDIIYDNAPYKGLDGTSYPAGFPKNEIAELSLVTEVAQPVDSTLVVTGFHIDANDTQVYDTRPKTAQELADEAQSLIDQMRAKRDSLLRESDYTQLPDTSLTTAKVAEYVTYRQELKDLPALYPDGVGVVYPTKPV